MKLFTLFANTVVYDDYKFKSKGILDLSEINLISCDQEVLESRVNSLGLSLYQFTSFLAVMRTKQKNLLIFENGNNSSATFRSISHLRAFINDYPMIVIDDITYITKGITVNRNFPLVLIEPL